MTTQITKTPAEALTEGDWIRHPYTGETLVVTWVRSTEHWTQIGYSVTRGGRNDTSFLQKAPGTELAVIVR